jgi:hypothetical protein
MSAAAASGRGPSSLLVPHPSEVGEVGSAAIESDQPSISSIAQLSEIDIGCRSLQAREDADVRPPSPSTNQGVDLLPIGDLLEKMFAV